MFDRCINAETRKYTINKDYMQSLNNKAKHRKIQNIHISYSFIYISSTWINMDKQQSVPPKKKHVQFNLHSMFQLS